MFTSVAGKRPASETFEVVHKKKEKTCQSHSIMRVGRRRRSQMLRTVASPGTFGCQDCRFFHKCTEVTDKADTLRIVVHPSPPAFCASEGRKRHASLHWQGVARAKRAQRPLLRGESSGPQMTPGESPDDISGNFFFPHKKVKKQLKNYTKKTGNFLDWDFGIWPKRDGFRDILAYCCYDRETSCPSQSFRRSATLDAI